LDFLNCIENQNGGLEFFYVGFSLDLWLKGNWESGIKILMQDGLGPSNYAFSLRYLPEGYFGFNAGIYGYSYFIEDFDYLFRQSNPELLTYDDDNYFQMIGKDIGFMAGLSLHFNRGSLHSNLNLNVGTATTHYFKQTFTQKKQNSNYKRILIYETKPSWALIVFPELSVSYDIIKRERYQMGVEFQSNFLMEKKSIDYELRTFEWTSEFEKKQSIENPKHTIKKFETSIGIYFKW
jgi:hypothetical protein